MDALMHLMVEGTSEPQDFQLLDDGVAFVGTGISVGIEWSNTTPPGPPSVAWLNQPAGTVRVTNTENMAVGDYTFRFFLVDGAAKVGYIPNLSKDPNHWRVVRL